MRKDWHYFKETADQMKLLNICFLAAHPCKHRVMNKDEVFAEIFADQDSDVSDFSNSEFESSVSDQSEEEEEEDKGEQDKSWQRCRQN